jgi:tetratricopeptide (TPR) repeat protein
MKSVFGLVAVLVIGFSSIFGLSGYIESVKPILPEEIENEDLTFQAAKLKGYSLGFDGLIADWYWMRALHYLGERISKSPDTKIDIGDLRSFKPRLLYPLLDSATTLDPRFLTVYSYGAVVLPAIDPNEWRLYQHLGYIYWQMGKHEKASEIYQTGSKIEGAPIFMQMMVAQMKSQGGSRETARKIFEQMAKDAQDTQTKEVAELRLLQLNSLDERDVLQKVLDDFKAKNNRCPNNWKEIFPLLITVKLPNNQDFRIDQMENLVDPTGVPYILEKQPCQIQLNKASKIPFQ